MIEFPVWGLALLAIPTIIGLDRMLEILIAYFTLRR